MSRIKADLLSNEFPVNTGVLIVPVAVTVWVCVPPCENTIETVLASNADNTATNIVLIIISIPERYNE